MVCCMYATKEATIAKEHDPSLDIHVFMMDMRAFSKGYWGYFERARDRYGIRYTRCRISALREDPSSRDLIVHYRDEDGAFHDEQFDLVVLSVGMEISESVRDLGRRLGVELDEYGFCHTVQFNPLETSRPGIYAVGPFREPKDIPESVVEASGAAAAAAARLSPSRFTLTTTPEYPPERDVTGEEPRTGVFVCHCGSNIAGYLDVPDVATYARTLPGVVHAESNLYTCSQDSVKHIAEQIKEHNLNRVVVASCSPLTHEPLFRDCLRSAGLNPYLFEMANIRNQCSWVHSGDWNAATGKARDLVRMAAARAALLQPQHTFDMPVQKAALVVGGGAAGMTAAIALADQGFPVHLVEWEAVLGGNLRHVFTRSNGTDPQAVLRQLIEGVEQRSLITPHLESRVTATSGHMGDFTTTIEKADGDRIEVRHGATILATGAQEYRGPDYGFGSDRRIVTQQQFEAMLASPAYRPVGVGQPRTSFAAGQTMNDGLPQSVVMIQCVGPAEQFCARICCTVALKNALALKERNPDAQVVVLYRDIRTYGFKERIYEEARRKGVIFVRYDADHRPQVETGETLAVHVREPQLGRELMLTPDLLVLSMPVVLRPVDFATDGVFMAGAAHYPKLLDETLIQAQAAAARAARVLSREALTAGGQVAVVDATRCTGCLTCVRICPFSVPLMRADLVGVGGIQGAAYIEPAICQGCGTCVSECPARAIQLMHYTDIQLQAKVTALFEPSSAGFIPISEIG